MNKTIVILISILFAAIVLANSLYIVDQRKTALVLQFGEPVGTILEPGIKIKAPFIQQVIYFDRMVQNLSSETIEVYAKDSKQVRVNAFAKYVIKDPLKFYQSAQNELNFKNRFDNILNSNLRQVIGEVPFKSLLKEERVNLMHKIRQNVNKEALTFGVEVLDVRILRADLPDASREAVYLRMNSDRLKEAKEIRAEGAEQAMVVVSEAEKKKRILLAEAQKKANLLLGQGEAEASKIYANSFGKDAAFFEFYRSMEAYKKSISESDTIFLSENGKFLKYMAN